MAINKPFTHGLLFKGAYTLSKAMNDNDADGRATLAWNTPSEKWRNWGPAGFDRRHNFQLAFAYALPWQSNGGYDNILKAIVQDWQINGMFAAFSGTPFHVTASGTSLNTPQNTQTANLVGTFTVLGKGRQTATGSIRPRLRSRQRRVRQRHTESVLRSWREELRLLAVPYVPDGRHAPAGSTNPGEQHLRLGRVRQSAEQHHVGHVRPDHRHRG